MYESKTEGAYEDFNNDKEMFSNYSTKSKYYDNPNKLAVGKKKDETIRVAIEEFSGLKPKICSYLLNSNKKTKRQT